MQIATMERPRYPLAPVAAESTAPWIVFSDDWGRHPTSCQHLIKRLLELQQVVWVNMIGTRRLALDGSTVRRGFEKLGQWFLPRHAEPSAHPNMRIVSPRLWPGFGRNWERRFNRAWLVRQLRRHIDELPEPPIAITTMPTAADLIGELPVKHWVYYCVDDFSTWPGIDQSAARRLEDKLIDEADILIAVSETLCERIESRGRTAHLLTHGVDLEFWSATDRPRRSAAATDALREFEPPFAVFWGLIDRRLDVDFLQALSASMKRGTVVLIGPEDRPDPAIERLPRVVRRPQMPLATLPEIAAAADVLVMPYVDEPVTRAMQPLKLKEYLATGKPAVVRDIPAVRSWADCLDVADSPQKFAELVCQRLESGLPVAQRTARERLVAEDWRSKAAEFARAARGFDGRLPIAPRHAA